MISFRTIDESEIQKMKRKLLELVLIATMVYGLCACSKKTPTANDRNPTNATILDETTKPTYEPIAEPTTAQEDNRSELEDNSCAKWNGTFIAQDGTSITLEVSKDGKVSYKYVHTFCQRAEKYDITENTISISGTSTLLTEEYECGAILTLNKDYLRIQEWSIDPGESEKRFHGNDIELYRDGKSPNETFTASEEEEKNDPYGTKAFYTYFKVLEDGGMADGYEGVIEADYLNNGAVSFHLIMDGYGSFAYASYESESEFGTETVVSGAMGYFLGKVIIEIEDEYLYLTEGDVTTKYQRQAD